jgi:hypothetical protein
MSEYQTAVHKALDMIRAAADHGPLFLNAAINSAYAVLLSDKVVSLTAPGKPKRTLATLAARDAEIRMMLQEGVMADSVACRFGLTVSRIRQIAEAAPSTGRRTPLEPISSETGYVIKHRKALGWSVARISGETGLSAYAVNRYLAANA